MTGDQITLGTARAMLLLLGLAWGRMITAPEDRRGARLLWTSAWLLLVLHSAAAFHFTHHWSLAAAYLDTAEKTERLIGWRIGSGVYYNYALLLLWGTDVAWWWTAPRTYAHRPAWIGQGLHAFLIFMIINAGVVFVSSPIRWITAAGLLVLLILWATRRGRGDQAANDSSTRAYAP